MSTEKRVTFNEKARKGLKQGADLITDAVKATLGPRGRTVIYGSPYSYPVSTKDGVTVARQVQAKDQLEQLGVLLIRQVAQKTADDTGDGTTTACVLAQAIFTEGLKSISAGANPVLVKRGIDKAVDEVVEFIKKKSIEVKDSEAIMNVAKLSANNEESLGKLISEAIEKVGEDGVITIEDNYAGAESQVETVEGMQLNEGLISPFLVTDREREVAEYFNPMILLYAGTIMDVMTIKPIVEEVLKREKPMVIIAHDILGVALESIVRNKAEKGLNIAACKASQFGKYRDEMMIDVAELTGGKVIGPMSGIKLEETKIDHLGQCRSFKAGKFSTTIIGGAGDPAIRIKQIESEMEAAESDYDKEKLQERYAKLTSGVAIVRVGSHTEIEQKEKKMRVEDALHATRAAMEGGIVPGGGTMYMTASRNALNGSVANDEEEIGYRIVQKALLAPIKQIAENSGISGEEVIANLGSNHTNERWGYNFLTNEYVDMVETGIIDPTKVVISVLKNAASVAGMLLTTEVAINEEEEYEPPVPRTPKPKSE